MAITGKIVTLTYTATDSGLFPRTKTSAITNDEGVNLDVLLDNVNSTIGDISSALTSLLGV